MDDMEKDKVKRVLNLPPVARVKYKSNFIKTAVCELRFPTLLELESKPPKDFQAKIRKLYPFYEPEVMQRFGDSEGDSNEHRYLFRSKDRHWTITVKSFALAIETSRYVDFEDFFARFKLVLDSAKEMIDSDFFTRIGFRYINSIPIEDGKLDGWIRPELILPLTEGALGSIKSSASIIHGYMEQGEYSLRHGLKTEDKGNMGNDVPNYVLDVDYYSENIEFDKVEHLIKHFNETNFAFFSWCLGEKAKKLLGEGKQK